MPGFFSTDDDHLKKLCTEISKVELPLGAVDNTYQLELERNLSQIRKLNPNAANGCPCADLASLHKALLDK